MPFPFDGVGDACETPRGRFCKLIGILPGFQYRAQAYESLPAEAGQDLSLAAAWRGDGLLRDNALLDYFSGGFDGAGEGLLLHGSISRNLASSFLERMQRGAQDFAQQHQADQKLAGKEREGYTLLLAMRRWEFEAFPVRRR